MVLKIVPFDFVFVVVVRSNSLENVDHARLSLAIKKMPLGWYGELLKLWQGVILKKLFLPLRIKTPVEKGDLSCFSKKKRAATKNQSVTFYISFDEKRCQEACKGSSQELDDVLLPHFYNA